MLDEVFGTLQEIMQKHIDVPYDLIAVLSDLSRCQDQADHSSCLTKTIRIMFEDDAFVKAGPGKIRSASIQ